VSAYDVESGDQVHRGGPVTVDRYTAGARINHWLTAISLVLLALSGLALFHPSLFFLTRLFGGGQMTRIIHPWIGVVLFLSFFALFVRFCERICGVRSTSLGWRGWGRCSATTRRSCPRSASTMPVKSSSSGRCQR
jgi:thiosulfate reductase cytochrome b subunit